MHVGFDEDVCERSCVRQFASAEVEDIGEFVRVNQVAQHRCIGAVSRYELGVLNSQL